jgi:hypothetical protein
LKFSLLLRRPANHLVVVTVVLQNTGMIYLQELLPAYVNGVSSDNTILSGKSDKSASIPKQIKEFIASLVFVRISSIQGSCSGSSNSLSIALN